MTRPERREQAQRCSQTGLWLHLQHESDLLKTAALICDVLYVTVRASGGEVLCNTSNLLILT